MDIVVAKDTNMLIHIGKRTGVMDNGYPIFDKDYVFIQNTVNVFENIEQEITEDMQKNPNKYCYTPEKGFYDWVEPVNPEVETIRQEYRDELAQEVSQNVYDA